MDEQEQVSPGVQETPPPAAANAVTAASQDSPAAETEQEEPFDRERALATIRKLREQEKLARQLAKELEEKKRALSAYEQEKLSEKERLERKLAELEQANASLLTEIQQARLQSAIERHAARLGIVDPEAAAVLIDRAAVEFDEDGRPANVEALLKDLIKAKPYLARPAAPSAGLPANPASNPAQRAGVFRESQLRDYRFWEQHRDEILRAMREGRIVQD